MKWPLIIANVLAAIVMYFLSDFAVAAHRAHAYSVYKELQTQHVLVERSDYDIEKRLEMIADGGRYSLWIADIGAAICLGNALLLAICFEKPKPNPSNPN